MVPNRSITDAMHFNRDLVTIQTGGKLTLVDETKQPHSFSAVRRGQVPKTLRAVEDCFGKGPCDELAVAHGAVNPDTGEEQDPTTPLVNVGKDGFNTARRLGADPAGPQDEREGHGSPRLDPLHDLRNPSVDAEQGQGRPARRLVALIVLLAAASASPAEAAVRHEWVAAVPTTWNIVPNGRDGIMGTTFEPSQTVFPTVVYRRFTKGWKKPLRNAPVASVDHDMIPGPLLHARVGDRLRIHFKNKDPNAPHSMHFHGVHYKPSSDGAYIPGFSGKDGNVKPGQTYTYKLDAGPDSAGVWPYHDHSPSMHESLAGGLWGALSIRGRHERKPDREFVTVFAAMQDFQTINGRAFVGNTPIYRSRVGDRVQWDVLAIGDEHHTFHVHGHRWRTPAGVPEDTRTLGPAESFRVSWREDAPGTWLYHCHVEQHMAKGMIGIYRVSPR